MAGFLTPSTVVVRVASPTQPATAVVQQLGPGGYAGIKNIGGRDRGKKTPGPDDVWLLVGAGTNVPDVSSGVSVYPNAYLLLAGDSVTLPADLETIYAVAANTVSTLTVVVAVRTR